MTTMALASILSRSMTLIGTACGEVFEQRTDLAI